MIPAATVFVKSRAGVEEVKSRKLKLPPKLRTLLILVDGSKPALVLNEEAAALGAAADALEQLEHQGLIERVGSAPAPGAGERRAVVREAPHADVSRLDPAARFRAAQQFMNDTAVNALGLKAFFFTLKLEKCATVDDLRALAGDFRQAIAKASGEAEAEVLSRRVAEILG
jgi:hypothetical protein